MSITTIEAFSTKKAAQTRVGFWIGQGREAAIAGPTTLVEAVGCQPQDGKWYADEQSQWWTVLSTEGRIEKGKAPAASAPKTTTAAP